MYIPALQAVQLANKPIHVKQIGEHYLHKEPDDRVPAGQLDKQLEFKRYLSVEQDKQIYKLLQVAHKFEHAIHVLLSKKKFEGQV